MNLFTIFSLVFRHLVVVILFLITDIAKAQDLDIYRLRNEFNTQYDSGHFDQALLKADTIIDYWKSRNVKDSVNYYRYKHTLTLGQKGDIIASLKEADELIQTLEKDPPLPSFAGSVYFLFGKYSVYLSNFSEATEKLNTCIAFEKSQPTPNPLILAQATEWQGIVCIYTDRFEEAQELVEEALAMKYAIYDSSAIEIAYTLNSLAGVYDKRNMLAEMDASFVEAYRILKLHLPPDHPHVLTVAVNLSNVKSGMGEISEALELLEGAIAGHEKQHAVHSLILDYNNLGVIYASTLHDSERARTYFLRSLHLTDSLLPVPDINRANIYDGLGGTYLGEQNYLKADSFFRLSYRERQMMDDKISSGLGQSAYNLGITSEGLGDTSSAEAYYKKSLNYFSASFGAKHPKTANAMFELADLEWVQNNRSKALQTYKKCLQIYISNLTSRHAYPLQTNIKLAECFDEIHEADSTDVYIHKAWEGVCETNGKSIDLNSLSEYPIVFVDRSLNITMKIKAHCN